MRISRTLLKATTTSVARKLQPTEAAARMAAMDLSGAVPTVSFVYACLIKHPQLRRAGFEQRMTELLDLWGELDEAEQAGFLEAPMKGLDAPN